MSVINRMLRDLDARQQRPATAAPMAAIAPRPRSMWGWVLGVLIAALIGFGAWYWWQSDDAAPRTEVQLPASVVSSTPESAEVAPTTAAEPEPQPVMKVERRQLTPAELIARYQQQAREEQARGALETAAERYQQILALAPKHTETRQQLAALWYGQGYGSRSVALLREGLSLSANDTEANVALALTLARIHERLAQPEQAYAVLQRSTLTQPNIPAVIDTLALRAELARQLGQYQQAVADYQQLLTWQPSQARWYLAQAVAYEQLAQWPAARMSYQQAQQQAGLSVQSYEFIATRIAAINQQLDREEGL